MNNFFEEKQYLGYNQFNLIVRLIIASGCLFSYFFSESSLFDQSSDLFLILGISVLFISILLFLVPHIKTEVKEGVLILNGFWTTRIVKIDLKNIKKLEKVKYSKFLLNRPIYNLHLKGSVKFYTYGNWAVELTDKEGLKYKIGTQRADELNKVLAQFIK